MWWSQLLFQIVVFVSVVSSGRHGSIGTDSVKASGIVRCGGLPATRANVRLESGDANGNLAVVNETSPDKEGFFAIQGTEKEIALPEFYIVIVHQCSRTRPPVEKNYTEYIKPLFYYDSRDTRRPRLFSMEVDLLEV